MEKTKQKGRPLSDDPLRQRKIRATDEQWERWGAKAFEQMMTRSEWLRKVADRECERT